MTGVLSSFDIEFIAVPRTDYMSVLGMVAKRPYRAVGCHWLYDPLHDPALTHWPPAMGALVVPGMELTIDHENSYLGVPAFEQNAAAILEIVDSPSTVLRHDERTLSRMLPFDLSPKGGSRPARNNITSQSSGLWPNSWWFSGEKARYFSAVQNVAYWLILLQKSFCIVDQKISGP